MLIGISKLIATTDSRLLFNVFFYMVGVISASCFDWRFNFRHGNLAKLLILVTFIVLLWVGQLNHNFHLVLYRRAVGGVGVFALLFVCEYISNIFFGSPNSTREGWKGQICRVISFVSYASMACYMFHRLFFWAGEKIFNPNEEIIKWIYMAGIVFPSMLVLSYYIQKGYDIVMSKRDYSHKQH